MSQNPNQQQHFTRGEAADYLRVSRGSIDNWTRAGMIQSIKIGKGPRARVLYRRQDLDAFVNGHLVGGAPEA